MAKQSPLNIVGVIVGLILLILGGVLVAITKLEYVDPSNAYLSKVSTLGVVYAVLFGVGFVIFVTFLHVIFEDRAEK